MVVTSLPSTLVASVRHELTGRPSTSTVQEPQTPTPHPSTAPVRCSSSRRYSSSVWFGLTAISRARPLMVVSITILAILPSA